MRKIIRLFRKPKTFHFKNAFLVDAKTKPIMLELTYRAPDGVQIWSYCDLN